MHAGRRASLSSYQTRVLRDYERIIETVGLHPDRALQWTQSEPDAVVPILKSMTDQAVRSVVIFEYTLIDMELEFVVFRHFFGAGKKLNAARKTQRYRTLRLMLQNTYLMQKLSIVRKFKEIPKLIVSSIAAINDLRNGLAHMFLVSEMTGKADVQRPKHLYP
jgi:hypothetical protein